MIPSCFSYIRAVKVLRGRTCTFMGNVFLLGKHCSGNEMATTIFSETAKSYLLPRAENDYIKKLVWGMHVISLPYYIPLCLPTENIFPSVGHILHTYHLVGKIDRCLNAYKHLFLFTIALSLC